MVSLFILPTALRAEPQSVPPVVVGSRIRIEVPTVLTERLEGTVIEMNDQSLLIEGMNRSAIRVRRSDITQLDISIGRRRQIGKGAVIGAGLGAVMMGLGMRALEIDKVDELSVFVLAGATSGAIWGAGIGALIKRDRWIAVPVPPVHVGSSAVRRRLVLPLVSVGF